MRLSQRDFDQLQRTILELYDCRQLEPLQQALPCLFLKLIAADWFVLMDVKIDMRRKRVSMFNCWESSRIMSVDLVHRMARVASDHPFSHYSLETRDQTALKFSDFFSVDQLRRSELYNEFYRYAKVGRLLAAASFNGRALTTLNAVRPLNSPDFTERDRLIMDLLRPHFEQARRVAERNTARAAAKPKPLDAYGLTPREREVALWIAEGKTSLEIGIILQSATRTVEKHTERIFAKLGVENRTAAALIIASAADS